MCEYCGCQQVPTIGQLTAEHDADGWATVEQVRDRVGTTLGPHLHDHGHDHGLAHRSAARVSVTHRKDDS